MDAPHMPVEMKMNRFGSGSAEKAVSALCGSNVVERPFGRSHFSTFGVHELR
jgi:hypothetical protein